mgnify:CR=1 FL=1
MVVKCWNFDIILKKFLFLSRCETGRGLYKLEAPIRAQADGHICTRCAVLIFAFTTFRFHDLHETHYPSLLSCCWLNYETNHFWHTRDRLQLQGRHVAISFQCSSLFNDWQPKFCYRTSKESVHFGHLWFIHQIIGLIWMLTIKLSHFCLIFVLAS